MNPFPSPLHYDNAGFVNGKRLILVTPPFRIVTSLGVIDITEPFLCDGASIPKIAQSIVGHPFEVFLEDCIGHDWCYSELNKRFTRAQSDFMLKETMWNRRHIVSAFEREALYRAVRWFGASSFKAKLP